MKRFARLTGLALLSLLIAGVLSSCSGDCTAVTAERDELRVELEGMKKTVELQATRLAAEQKEMDRLKRLFATQIAADELRIQMIVDGVELIIPSDLLWESGKANATITDEGREYAKEVAAALAKTDLFISVIGHTDNVKPGAVADKYPSNWELAAARATNAVKFLIENGVDPKRIAAVSRGEHDPVASNDTPEGRAANRRIQVILRNI